MGKEAGDQRQRPPDGAGQDGAGGGAQGSGRCFCGVRLVRLQCVAALVLGAAVLLSALFWLPPFAGRGRGGAGDQAPDPGAVFRDDIVASFRLQKTVPELEGNTSKLELDIYTEVAIPNSIVVVNLLHPLAGSNWTNVVFSTVPYPKNLTISSTWLSILRSSFMSLVVRQSTFHLTRSLFGNSSSFEVLKFPIYKVQDRTDELKDQMKTTLLINSNEVLWVMVPRPVAPALTHKEASSRIRATSCGMDGEAPSNTPELRCFQIIHAVSRVAVARPLRRGLGVIRFAASHQWLSDASLSGGLQGIWSQESTSNQICFEKGQVRSR